MGQKSCPSVHYQRFIVDQQKQEQLFWIVPTLIGKENKYSKLLIQIVIDVYW